MKLYELYLYFFVSLLYLSISTGQERSCFEEFTITAVESSFVSFIEINSNISSLVVNVSESIAYNDILYYIAWKDDLSTPPYINVHIDDDTAWDYVNIGYNVVNMSVYIVRTMMGIVDFNNNDRQENLFLDVYFKFSNNPDLPCKIDITHDIQDENTEEPHFENEFYTVEVREDFPLNIAIPGLQPITYDFDADFPNNVFRVDSSSGCPIDATEPSYTCQEGEPVIVSFYLSQPLDYDAMDTLQYNCTVTLTDSGDPPKMSNSIISLNVISFPDEDPVFTSNFYKGYLAESLAGSVVEVIPSIIATDADIPPSLVSYSMNPANSNGGENYFAIDSSSGEVTVIQDIENDILELNQVDFILFACDENDQCANSFLSIKFPFLSPPGLDGVEFEKDAYTTRLETPSMGETVLQIRAHSSVNEEGILYSFFDDGSVGLQYFDINETLGIIFATQEDIPLGYYELTAMAADGNMTDEAMVNIQVLFNINGTVILTNNIVYATVPENSYEHQVHTITGSGAFYFCILDVYPEYFSDSFNVTRNGIIYTVSFLDAENPYNESLITIKAGAYSNPTDCFFSTVKAEVLSNEVLIVVDIDDEDEFVPYFIDAAGQHVVEILYAFPEELFLQRAIGPVATIMGMDDDVSTDILIYELLPSAALDSFQMDYSSGELYLTSEEMILTEFYVRGHSPLYVATMVVHIVILPPSYISTMYFTNIEPSDIKNKISEVSARAKVSIYFLYSTLVRTSADYRTVAAQVYSTDGLKLLDWQELKNQLDAAGVIITVKPFSDQMYFLEKNDTSYTNNTSTDDFKTSTIVLGCTSGFLFLLTMIVLVYTLMHKKQEHQDNKKGNATGQAYENEDFRNEESEPSFASIFGNNPLDGNVLKDSVRRTKKSTSTD